MKYRSFVYLSAFVALILLVGLACGPVTTVIVTATAQPINTTAPQQPATNVTSAPGTSAPSAGDYTSFTDQNKYYKIDVPSGWTHSQTTDKQNNYYYIDTFDSPDKNGLVENIAYDDGTAFNGSDNGRFALYLLNTFYSTTKQEGDIHVTNDAIQKDGSERLTWYSKGGGYSGITYFEVRNKTTFLMFTVEWANANKDQYFDTLDHVVASYTIP